MMNKDFDRWEFIMKWLPDYHRNEDVAYSNDLDCYINGETECSEYYTLQETFPDIRDAEMEQEAVDARLFAAAYENYKKVKADELEQKRRELFEQKKNFRVMFTMAFQKNFRAIDEDEAKAWAADELNSMISSLSPRFDDVRLANVKVSIEKS